MSQLLRVARNVGNLAAALSFYEALGFTPTGPAAHDAELASLLEVEQALCLRLQLGAQVLELSQLTPQGAPYPSQHQSISVTFQHIAICTADISIMQAQALAAGATPISHGGPQQLPQASGGVIAWKFRDPEGHPLEFLEIPGRTAPGYDHSAICVSDAARSIHFYEQLGLTMRHRHLNHGPAQARLDGMETGLVEVIAMAPSKMPPHVELLAYPNIAPASPAALNAIASDRLVFAGEGLALRRDPDGHILLFDGRAPS